MPEKKPVLIFKDEHTKKKGEYFQMNNAPVQDSGLSLAAKGLLCYFISKPSGWVIHFRQTMKETATRRTVLDSLFKELEKAGHLHKVQGEDYRNDTKYLVYENPNKNPDWIGEDFDDIP
ncbi:hypothetical protein AGMMS49942_19860 [Spirochaetia bacterium]|nr:hypothetical protein AGMMS49942_19860 [Spirochaetia bacterium]